MTIAATLLTSGSSDTDANSYTTASVSPTPNSLLVCFAMSAHATAAAPNNVFSGLGLTFVEQATVVASAAGRKLTLVTAQCGASPGSGTLLITATASTAETWAVIQVTGHAAVTPVVQTATGSNAGSTTGTATLGGGSGAGNRSIAAFGHRAQTLSTPRANWLELSDDLTEAPAGGFMTEWHPNVYDNPATASWTTTSAWVGIAVEIAAAVVTRRVFYRRP